MTTTCTDAYGVSSAWLGSAGTLASTSNSFPSKAFKGATDRRWRSTIASSSTSFSSSRSHSPPKHRTAEYPSLSPHPLPTTDEEAGERERRDLSKQTRKKQRVVIRSRESPLELPKPTHGATLGMNWSRTYQGTAIRFAQYSTPSAMKEAHESSTHYSTANDSEASSYQLQDSPPSDEYAGDAESESESETELEPEEGHTPLDYQIPDDILKEAMMKSLSSGAAYWSHSLYTSPEGNHITVHYCKNWQQSEKVLPLFQTDHVLGFDIEWNPRGSKESIKDNASLIQLANESRIALFQIALFKGSTAAELVHPKLKAILEDPSIMKTGVSILSDCTRLKKFLGIEAQGLIELSHIHNLVTNSATKANEVSKKTVALALQVQQHLLLPLAKGEVRESDWHRELKHDQVAYAAADAYAGFRLFDVLESKRKKMRSRPPRPAFAELKVPILPGDVRKLLRSQRVSGASAIEDEERSESDAYETAVEEISGEDDEQFHEAIETIDGDVPIIDNQTQDFRPRTRRRSLPRINRTREGVDETKEGEGEGEDEEVFSAKQRIIGPEYGEAEAWAEAYLTNDREGKPHKVRQSSLRAYHLWHHQSLEASQIAGLLRSPPLQRSTVSNYILDAVSWENLPFDVDRIKILLGALPQHVVERRYWSVLHRLRR